MGVDLIASNVRHSSMHCGTDGLDLSDMCCHSHCTISVCNIIVLIHLCVESSVQRFACSNAVLDIYVTTVIHRRTLRLHTSNQANVVGCHLCNRGFAPRSVQHVHVLRQPEVRVHLLPNTDTPTEAIDSSEAL